MSTAKFPGPRVVLGGFLALSVTSGLSFYGIAVYLNAFTKERGWSLSSISFATTVFFATGGLVGLAVARLIARYDARRVMLVGAVSGAAALALLGHATSVWMVYLDYVLLAVGFSATGLIPVSTIVTRWYVARRAVALANASAGLSVGGMLLTPFAKWLADEVHMATATPILGAIWLIGTVPVILLLIKPDPEALGWMPDGERRAPSTVTAAAEGTPFREAVTSRFFWMLTAAFILLMAAQVGGLQQIVKLAEDRTGAIAAAFATLAVSSASVVGRLLAGRSLHRVAMTTFTVVIGVLQGLMLMLLAATYGVWFFGVLVLFGLTVGNVLMMQSLLISQRFGVRDYARLFSRLQLFVMLGTAGGPFLLGWLHDVSGSYLVSYLVAGGLSIVGAAVLWMAGPAERPEGPAARVPAAGQAATSPPPA
ncbi:MFS transporter [Cumulibacter manganitolerans]|uniref:MFS transporter n=1 Tax=Cumulibacter manganitolerans TaxID=1884992 RepID=UPI001885C6E2|nr:MFS transporter [Cumulibacter manganitolerans]